MAAVADQEGRQVQGFRSVRIEVLCGHHGEVEAVVDEDTGVSGPPCPQCGSTCTVYAPMLALARACVQAAPGLGTATVLRLLRDESGGTYGAGASGEITRSTSRRVPAAAPAVSADPAPNARS
jgi:hypothetical protein